MGQDNLSQKGIATLDTELVGPSDDELFSAFEAALPPDDAYHGPGAFSKAELCRRWRLDSPKRAESRANAGVRAGTHVKVKAWKVDGGGREQKVAAWVLKSVYDKYMRSQE